MWCRPSSHQLKNMLKRNGISLASRSLDCGRSQPWRTLCSDYYTGDDACIETGASSVALLSVFKNSQQPSFQAVAEADFCGRRYIWRSEESCQGDVIFIEQMNAIRVVEVALQDPPAGRDELFPLPNASNARSESPHGRLAEANPR